jgi:hypothetical protein
MGYTETRPYDPDRMPVKVICPAQVEQYKYARSWCSEQFRRRDVECGPPVIEAWLPSKKRSPNDAGGRWWVLCQYHAERRGVLPVTVESAIDQVWKNVLP